MNENANGPRLAAVDDPNTAPASAGGSGRRGSDVDAADVAAAIAQVSTSSLGVIAQELEVVAGRLLGYVEERRRLSVVPAPVLADAVSLLIAGGPAPGRRS